MYARERRKKRDEKGVVSLEVCFRHRGTENRED